MTLEPVKEDLNDTIIELGKSIVETFVPAGAPAIKIFETLFGIPIQRRRETLIQNMCEAINKILEKGFVLEQLQQDENFIEFSLQAIKVASMTFKEEKRTALKNAIYNSAAHPNPPIFEMQQIFLCYIESFTLAHLQLLYFLINPRDWFVKNKQEIPRTGIGGIVTIRSALIYAYPELENQTDLINSIWADLYIKDFLDRDKKMLDMTPRLPSRKNAINMLLPDIDVLEGRVTPLGEQFVIFISE